MKIDFYLLSDKEPQSAWLFACRLLEKAYLRGHRVFVYCDDEHTAHHLDELLWTFKDDSFVPHNLQGEGPEPPPAIQIGYQDEPRHYNDILLNLATSIPPFFKRFQRILEIVRDNDDAKTISRQHYREYRQLGLTINTHQVNL